MDKIYATSLEGLKKEIVTLKEQLVVTKNDSEAQLCLASIYNINDMYKIITGEELIDFRRISRKNAYKAERARIFGFRQQAAIINNFIYNKELIEEISVNAYNLVAKELLQKDEDMLIKQEVFSEREAQEIVFDFLKEYHSKDIELFEQLVKNEKIFCCNNLDDVQKSLRGQCVYVYENLPYIVAQSPFYTVETLSYLIHEFGHAVDLVDLDKTFSANQREKFFMGSFNDEVIAKLYERDIIDFFIKHEINPIATADLLEDYYGVIGEALFETYFFTQLPDYLLKNEIYTLCDKEFLKEQLKNITIKDGIDARIDFSSIDISSTIKYATGGVVALLLKDKLVASEKEGRNIYGAFLNERCRAFSPALIETLRYHEGEFSDIVDRDFKTIRKYKK